MGKSLMTMVKLNAMPIEALMDEEVQLLVTNLKLHQQITVVASVTVASYIPDYKCVAINSSICAYVSNLSYKGRMWIGALPDLNKLYIKNNGVNSYNSLGDYLTVPLHCNSFIECIISRRVLFCSSYPRTTKL